jgi:fibronectin type 3 domain-containing protein
MINIRADGGVRLWIDNIQLIDAWNDAYYEKLSVTVFLITGEHQIRVDYFNKENRSSFRLAWAPPNEDSYVIPTSNLYGFYITYENIAQTVENTYTDDGLEIGRIYYYHVRAVNDAGESLPGNILEFYPIGLPDEPANLQAHHGDGYINLTWEQPRDVKGSMIIEYEIYRAVGVQNVMLYGNVSGNQTFFNDTDIINGETYFYYVIARNDAGDSIPSSSVQAVPVGRPSAPRNPKVEVHTDGLKITWASPKITGGADLKGYNVYRAVDNSNRTFVYWINDFMTLGYIDMDVQAGHNYTYWITTLNEIGESEFSQNVSFNIPPQVIVDDDDEVVDDDTNGKESKFPVAWVVIGIISLLIIIAVVLFFVIRNRQVEKKELMLGPVQAGGVGPGGQVDETFDIFHPDQVQQGEVIVQPVGQVVGEVQQPAQYQGYDETGQYYPQEGYPQEAYPQQGYPQDQYPPQIVYQPPEPTAEEIFQQELQDVFYDQGSPQAELPQEQSPAYAQQQYPQEAYSQQDSYQQNQQQPYYPQEGPLEQQPQQPALQDEQAQIYQEQPAEHEVPPNMNPFFAPPPASENIPEEPAPNLPAPEEDQ